MIEFELFIKYFAGKASPEEAMLIDEWASASEDRRAFFRSLHQSWLETGNEIYQTPDIQQEWEKLTAHKPVSATATLQPQKNRWLRRIAAAAAILLAATGSYFLFNNNVTNGDTITANAATHKDSLHLGDGTVVALKQGATISYPERFSGSKRDVQLTGSAFFEVTHNPQQPFLVHFDNLSVKVLGTSFEIIQHPDSAIVIVRTGKVAFYSPTDTIYINAGSSGRYNRSTRKLNLQAVTAVQEEPPATAFLDFDDVPLSEVAGRLSRHFKVDIVLQNAALKNCRLSAVFEHKTLTEILTAISETFNTTYKIESQHIYINGEGCE